MVVGRSSKGAEGSARPWAGATSALPGGGGSGAARRCRRALVAAGYLVLMASNSAAANADRTCAPAIGFTSTGQFVLTPACQYNPISKPKGFGRIKLSKSNRFTHKFSVRRDIPQENVQRFVASICESYQSFEAVYLMRTQIRFKSRTVFFACGPNQNQGGTQ